MFNKKLIFLAAFIAIVFILAVVYFFISGLKQAGNPPTSIETTASPTPASLQVDPKKDYSSLNKVVPGKATLKDVERINGKPLSSKTEGNKTYLYYPTPLEGFTNTVVLENNVVSYSIENVFGSYRGTVQSLRTSYGNPDFTLYGADGYFWRVYLKEGFVAETDRTDVTTIVYFIPQTKESFMASLAKELRLLEAPVEQE